MTVEALLSYLIPGILVGFVYTLIALGFILIYKSSGVLNIATGQIVLFGAYIAWTVTGSLGWPWWSAFVIVIAAAIVLALAVERIALRPLIGQPVLTMVIMTLGLAVVLEGLMTMLWGHEWKKLPPLFPGEPIAFLGVNISTEFLGAGIVAMILVAILAFFFRYTNQGLAMRATADDTQCAQSLGISAKRVLQYSWIISCISCGIAGILLCVITNVHYTMSWLGLKAIAVVLVGGLESIVGALIAGPMIGAIEFLCAGYLDPYVGGGLREVAPFIVLILFVLFKPSGFFGWKRIERL